MTADQTERGAFFAIIDSGSTCADRSRRATITWPSDRPLVIPSRVVIAAADQVSALIDALGELFTHADSVVHNDIRGTARRLVRHEDLEILQLAMKRLQYGDRQNAEANTDA